MNPARLPCLLALAVLPVLAQTPQRWDFPFDPRDWKLVAESSAGRLTERIYVAPGENEYFWTERLLVAHQRLAFSPDDYLVGFLEFLDENCRPYRVRPLQQEQTDVLLEWEGDCRITGRQFEYRRVVVAKDGVHVLAYAAKTQRLTEPRRAAWLEILRTARLK